MQGSGLTGYRRALSDSSTCSTCLGQDLRASCQIYDNLQAAFLTELTAYLLLSVGSFIAVLCACSTKARGSQIRVKKANLSNTNHQESGKRRSCGTRQNCQAHSDNLNNDTNRDRQSNRKSQSNRKRAEASVTQVEIQNKPRSAAAATSSPPSTTGTSWARPSGGGGRLVVPWAEQGLRVMGRLTGGLVAERSVEEMTGVVLGTFVRLVGCVQVALLPLMEDQQSAGSGIVDVDDGSTTNCPHSPAPLTAAVQASGPGARTGPQLPVPPSHSAWK